MPLIANAFRRSRSLDFALDPSLLTAAASSSSDPRLSTASKASVDGVEEEAQICTVSRLSTAPVIELTRRGSCEGRLEGAPASILSIASHASRESDPNHEEVVGSFRQQRESVHSFSTNNSLPRGPESARSTRLLSEAALSRNGSLGSIDIATVDFVLPPNAPSVPALPTCIGAAETAAASVPEADSSATKDPRVADGGDLTPTTPRASRPSSTASSAYTTVPNSVTSSVSSVALAQQLSIMLHPAGPPPVPSAAEDEDALEELHPEDNRAAADSQPGTRSPSPFLLGRPIAGQRWARKYSLPSPNCFSGSASLRLFAGLGELSRSDALLADLPAVPRAPPVPMPWSATPVAEAKKQLDSRSLQQLIVDSMRTYGSLDDGLVLEGGLEEMEADLKRRTVEASALSSQLLLRTPVKSLTFSSPSLSADRLLREREHCEALLRSHICVLRSFNADEGARFAERLASSVLRCDALATEHAALITHNSLVERLRSTLR